MRILMILMLLLGANSLEAATILSIDQNAPLKGEFKGIDTQKRLMVTPEGKETTIGVRMDGIQEVDFERKVKEVSAEDARFRFVFDDGSVVFGDIAEQSEDDAFDWLKISTKKRGDIKTYYDGLVRIERRSEEKAAADKPFSKEEIKRDTNGLDWKLYKADGGSTLGCTALVFHQNRVEFEIGVDDTIISMIWKEVRSIVKRAPETSPFDTLYTICTTTNGERFVGTIESWEKGEIKLKTRHFKEVTLKESELTTMIFRNGRFTFLSDTTPSEVKEYPFLRSTKFKAEDHLFPYQRDRAQGGGSLKIGGKSYAKGLGVHAISRLSYRLDKQYSRFSAIIGIDDSAGDKASVVFRVYVDGKEAKMKLSTSAKRDDWKEADNSGIIRKNAKPIAIEVDVLRAKKITIVVEAADNADVHDRANWANAMLIR